ncbi:MAG: DUF4397 domain-containing protein [Pedobacter sp.]|nr:MAG: DUF4397 domain-containing protein [Pedobacter sp.]
MSTKMYFKPKNNWLLILSVVFLGILSGCSKKDEVIAVEGTAKVRLANAVPGSVPQDFYLNTTKIISNIAFGQSVGYQTITSGTVNMFFTTTGTQDVNASLGAYVQPNSNYTVFYARSSAGQNGILGVADDIIPPAAGRASVRFINLNASSSATISISAPTGNPIVTSLAENAISSVYSIDPALLLTATISGTTIVQPIAVGTFVAGKSYIVWFTGTTAADFAAHIMTTT